jgi:hypothetical protein
MTLAGMGLVWAIWFALAVPTILHLAGRKTDTKQLTVFWGIIAALIPPLGLLFILALLLKNDRPAA